MPNVVQPGAPPFADLQRYDDLPFVIVPANNTSGIEPGIYCYLDISTGTDDPVLRASTRVYPNPASGALTIEAASPVRSAEWMDNVGRILRTENFAPGNRVQVDLQRFSPGCYLLKLTTDGGVEVHRVVLD